MSVSEHYYSPEQWRQIEWANCGLSLNTETVDEPAVYGSGVTSRFCQEKLHLFKHYLQDHFGWAALQAAVPTPGRMVPQFWPALLPQAGQVGSSWLHWEPEPGFRIPHCF